MSGRALSGERRYEGMVLGVGGGKSYFRDWESESTEVMKTSYDGMVKAFELYLRISRDGD
jgi:hypothetical protein